MASSPADADLDMLKLLAELRELHHMGEAGIGLISDKIVQLFMDIEQSMLGKLAEAEGHTFDRSDVADIIKSSLKEIQPEPINTFYTMKEALRKRCGMVPPQEFTIFTEYVEDKYKNDVTEKIHTCQIVPLRESLAQILNVKEIYDFISKPPTKNCEYYSSIYDGSFVQSNAICQNYTNPLLICLYEDDFEVTNPLGSYTKKHKVQGAYFTILNIPVHLQSNLKCMSLVSLCKSEYVKEHGFEGCFGDFLTTIQELESPEGLTLQIAGNDLVFHGTLACVLGDSLAMNHLGGFKEGIGWAHAPCRLCISPKEIMKKKFYVDEIEMRTKDVHATLVEKIVDENEKKGPREALSVKYGITGRCLFCKLHYFDVTKNLPFDIMHNLCEGVAPVEIKALLFIFIEKRKALTYAQLNHLLMTFPYPKCLAKDKPSPIERHHVVEGNLRQSASQILCLVAVLPLILAPFAKPKNCPYLRNFVLLAQITSMLLAYKIKRTSIVFLQHLIYVHHTRFAQLYPDVSITPKFHFLLHAPFTIELFGPIRITWCMRFEARHAIFKTLARYTQNFINIVKTLAVHFQIRRCMDLLYGDPNAIVLGANNFKYVKSGEWSIDSVPFGHTIAQLLCQPENANELIGAQEVSIENFSIEQGTILVCEENEDDLPQFGRVISMFVYKDKCVLVLNCFDTAYHDYARNAYVTTDSNEFRAVLATTLPSLQTVPFVVYKNVNYAILNNYDRNEFAG